MQIDDHQEAPYNGLDYIEHEEVVGVSFDGVLSGAMCKLPLLEVSYSNQGEVLSDVLTPEAMVGRFRSAPEAMVKIDDDGIAEREKANIDYPVPEALYKINKAEFPGSRKAECLKIHPIAAMTTLYSITVPPTQGSSRPPC
jgi:hypothetical protein